MKAQSLSVRPVGGESSGKLSQLPPLRGLDIRIQWGKARVMRFIDAEQAGYEMSEAKYEAETEGHHDYRAGRNTLPHMFADVPELARAWRLGHASAGQSDEMAGCSGCNNDGGEPCPYHD
ncbi:hypothetical protein [Erwinia mallotivora]|uniref:hypothetical protein n=1 Tax=Erwinia mallotivora TaxID=69222 RepID=UPI0021BF02E6|nr:hypothetical protein [Erwinia mallotivora]